MREKDWRRRAAAVSGLTCVGIAVLIAPNIFLEHSLDPDHLLSHSMYKALIVLCAILLIRGTNPGTNPGKNLGKNRRKNLGKNPRILDRLKTLDLNTFDAFQYVLARKIQSLANGIRKIQTGNLNLNMLGFLVGFIICLLFLVFALF